jgi:hypothetical protein
MKRSITIVSLSGGLGNQLFQLFAAYHTNPEALILIEHKAHNPEEDSKGALLIEHFDLLASIGQRRAIRFPNFIQRLASINLRFSLREKQTMRTQFLKFSSKITLTLFLSLKFMRRFTVITPTDVGFLPEHSSDQNVYLNGYFQNRASISSEKSKALARSMTVTNPDTDLQEWISNAKEVHPIVLHFRIGDYREHPGMGVLNVEYFEEAIDLARRRYPGREVWVFSDEPISAINLLQAAGITNLRKIPKFSPTSTIELMRHGSAFIISNSTFSWWAAALRYDESAPVWAPRPWFKLQRDPHAIYLEDWQLVCAWQNLSIGNVLHDQEGA